MKRMLSLLALIVSIALISACTPTEETEKPRGFISETTKSEVQSSTQNSANAPAYQWVQLGVDGAVIVRAIFEQLNQPCPQIDTVDKNNANAKVQMDPRTKMMPDNFDVTVCETTLADGYSFKSATLAGKVLKIPAKSPKKISVVGDTGCRKKTGNEQDCDPADKDGWHFNKTVKQTADLKPELVIHVGDFIYRECADETECGKDEGKNWNTWKADFFETAKPLLESAAWVFARGNHESCFEYGDQREWRGWFLFLDPRPLTNGSSWDKCMTPDQTRSAPFEVDLDGLDLLVLDSANEDGLDSVNQTAIDDLNKNDKDSDPVWLVTHVPLWGLGCCSRSNPTKLWANTPSGQVENSIRKSKIKFLVSGHLHLFEMIMFDNKPPQLITGGGATKLDRAVDAGQFASRAKSDFGANSSSAVHNNHNYTFVEDRGNGWDVTVTDPDDTSKTWKFSVKK